MSIPRSPPSPFPPFPLPATVIAASVKGQSKVIKDLLASGADVNHANHAGTTALHWAALEGHTGIVRVLLDAGARPDLKDVNGHTALAMSKQRRHLEIHALIQKAAAAAAAAATSPSASDDVAMGGVREAGRGNLLTAE
jgi:ankyrin repeat protein